MASYILFAVCCFAIGSLLGVMYGEAFFRIVNDWLNKPDHPRE